MAMFLLYLHAGCGWLRLAAIASDAVENVTKLASLGQVLPRAAPPPQQPRGRRNDKNSLHNISASESSTRHVRGELVILTAAQNSSTDFSASLSDEISFSVDKIQYLGKLKFMNKRLRSSVGFPLKCTRWDFIELQIFAYYIFFSFN